MKKLLASGCCILAFQNVSQVLPPDASYDNNGKRVLVKAIAIIVNAESNRKGPPKHICLPNLESPRV